LKTKYPKKETIAFIAHPQNLKYFRSYIKHLRPDKYYNDDLLIKLFEWTPPYKVKQWKDICIDGKNAFNAIMIMVPFLPEMRDISPLSVIKKVEQAISIAAQKGCTIASLGAFTSIVIQNREKYLSEKYNIKLTSGNTLTTTVIIKSIEDIVEKFSIKLKNQTLAIIGASGDIGTGCAIYFGDKVKKIILTARGELPLKNLVEKNKNYFQCQTKISLDSKSAIKEADLVIFSTSSHKPLFNIHDFKPWTIVCDASVPLNVELGESLRKDVFLYHGGIITLPVSFNPGFDIGLATSKSFYSCQIEGVLIALNESLPYSWGRGNLTRSNIDKYSKIIDKMPYMNIAYSFEKRLYHASELAENSTFWNNKDYDDPNRFRMI
jgi:predicted amino acid dehydrogenase